MKAQEVMPILLDAGSIAGLKTKRLPGMESTPSKLLWRSGGSAAGIMYVEAGSDLAPHLHRHAHHHVWVQEGHCTILGKSLGPGSYAHIPPGVEHGVTATDSDGATLFYLYINEASGFTAPLDVFMSLPHAASARSMWPLTAAPRS